SNATAGTAALPASQQTLTITNSNVTDQSLIYITPTSNTYNKVIYVKGKTGHNNMTPGSFTVSINSPIPYPIEFNWWIIN
ncbi:MAG: hypothetical protein GX648_10025, partial [Crenarchaeota archaeon]|nr:hypothetical protein [Thermoproteota archaeon]